MVLFMIVDKAEPLFEIEIGKTVEGADDLSYLHQFVLYSSLDMVNSNMWTNSASFLKIVDKFNYLSVSAYATQGGKIFLLLHNGKSEDAVRAFFLEVNELYVKYLMNPFSLPDVPITSPQFHANIRNLAKKLLGQ